MELTGRGPLEMQRLLLLSCLFSACIAIPKGGYCLQSIADSAGVRTVTYEETDHPAEHWRLGEPVVRMGGMDAAGPYQFWDVVGALMLQNGTFVVADGGSCEIRFFDPRGAHLLSIGGKGEGPGKLRGLWNLWFERDSLVAIDGRRQAHFFNSDGTFGRTLPTSISPVGTRMSRVGFLPDGAGLAVYADPPSETPEGRSQGFLRIARLDEDNPSDLLRVPGYVAVRRGKSQPSSLVYGPKMQIALHGNGFCVGYSAKYSFSCYDPRGALQTRVIRENWPHLPVSEQDRDVFFHGMETANPGNPQALSRLRERTEFAQEIPAFGRWVTGWGNQIWIGPLVPEQESLGLVNPPSPETTEWAVFDSEGNWVSEIRTPAGFFLLSVGRDYVAGVERDALNVESVVFYRIRKE